MGAPRIRSLGHRAPLLWVLLPFGVGLVWGRGLEPLEQPWLWAGGALAALAGSAWAEWRRCPPGWWAVGMVAAGVVGGVLFIQGRERRLPEWERLPPREAEVVLRIERLFPVVEGRATRAGLATIVAAPMVIEETVGKRVYFALRPAPSLSEPVRGAKVRAVGVLASLDRGATEGFEGYLRNAGVSFRLTRGRILAEERSASAWMRLCAAAARRFEEALGQGLDDQPALRGVLRAMLLGRKNELTTEQGQLFMRSGTLHLFAISGLHVGVIAAALYFGLRLVRLGEGARAVVTLGLLWVYVEATGGTPSAVRAFTMAAFLLAAKVLRWPGNAVAALAGSALAVLVIDPFQLFGASFQMSYAVVTALLLFGLPLGDWLKLRLQPWASLPEPAWGWGRKAVRALSRTVLGLFGISLAATLVSSTTSVAVFGWFTPGALLTNMVLVPAASLAIVAGAISLLAGVVGLGPVCVLFNHAAIVTIAAMQWLLSRGVQVPGMFWPARFEPGWLGGLALAGTLALVIAGYALRWRWRWGGFLPPLVWVALTLATMVRFGTERDAAEGALRSEKIGWRAVEKLFEVSGGGFAVAENGVRNNGPVQRDGRLHAADEVFAEGSIHALQGNLPVRAVGDEFPDHAVVIGRDGVAAVDVGIDSDAVAAGGVVEADQPG